MSEFMTIDDALQEARKAAHIRETIGMNISSAIKILGTYVGELVVMDTEKLDKLNVLSDRDQFRRDFRPFGASDAAYLPLLQGKTFDHDQNAIFNDARDTVILATQHVHVT